MRRTLHPAGIQQRLQRMRTRTRIGARLAGRAQRSTAQVRHIVVVGHNRIHLRVVDGGERRVDHQAGGEQLEYRPELVRALRDDEVVVALERIALDVAPLGLAAAGRRGGH